MGAQKSRRFCPRLRATDAGQLVTAAAEKLAPRSCHYPQLESDGPCLVVLLVSLRAGGVSLCVYVVS